MHITEKDKEAFKNSTMTTNQVIAFLEHLDHCSFCLQELAENEEKHSSVSAPAYLKHQILNAASSPEIQASKAVRNTSYRMQRILYSLRTTAGLIMALFLLFSIGQVDFSTLSPALPKSQSKQTAVNRPSPNYLDDFSQQFNRSLSAGTNNFIKSLNEFFK